MSIQRNSQNRCFIINYNSSQRAYIKPYGPLTSTVWTFLSDQHKKNTGCLTYGFLENVKNDVIEPTNNFHENEAFNKINIQRSKTYYNIEVLFYNNNCTK